MVLHLQDAYAAADNETPHKSRDAVRSKAWRERQANFLRELISSSGVAPVEGSIASYMAQLKRVYPALWSQILIDAPATVMRHDPSLTRQERRRLSSIKNNRLCRQRHALFLEKIEAELNRQGMTSARLTQLKGLLRD